MTTAATSRGERAASPSSPGAATIRRLSTASPGFDAELDALVAFEAAQDPDIDEAVARIIAEAASETNG